MTIEETIQAAEILRAAQTTAKVAYLLESGDVAYGTARSVGNDRGAFARNGEDVRDLFLRVTTQSRLEAFLPVRELMPKVSSGEFCLYDWSRRAGSERSRTRALRPDSQSTRRDIR